MVAAPPAPCSCGDIEYRPSRIADGHRFRLLWSEPVAFESGFDLCAGLAPPCPACPETCDLVLAAIDLPASPDMPITNASIHNVGVSA